MIKLFWSESKSTNHSWLDFVPDEQIVKTKVVPDVIGYTLSIQYFKMMQTIHWTNFAQWIRFVNAVHSNLQYQ